MADEPEKPRNYAEEAARIVTGESTMLPQREHLIAMAGQVQSVTGNLKVSFSLLMALLIDNDLPHMHFAAGLLKYVANSHHRLEIVQNKDGSITVRDASRQQPVIAPTSGSVN